MLNSSAIKYIRKNKNKAKAYIKKKLDIDIKPDKVIDDYFDNDE